MQARETNLNNAIYNNISQYLVFPAILVLYLAPLSFTPHGQTINKSFWLCL